jgi:succinoglycan biosynthesis transport protein ExoP
VDTQVTRTLDLRDYGRIVRASSRLIVATAALVGILSATYVLVRGPEYTATARVLVESIVNPAIGDLSGQAATVLQPVMSTETQVAQSVEVASSVKETTGLPESPQQLLSALEIENIRDTTVLLIKYTDPDPGRAARLANAFARQYLELRREQVRESVSVGRDALLARLNGTAADRDGKPDDRDGDGLADDGLRTELAQALERLQDASGTVEKGLAQVDVAAVNAQISEINSKLGQIDVLIATSQGGRLVSRAITPTSPSSPSVIFAALVGAVFGALIGAAGVIPAVAGWQERRKERLVTRDEPTSPAAEAYRTLATNIRFIGSKQRLQVLMLTSSLPEEGKTSTASNLAVVLAQSGLRTILVDSDLRRPRADRFLGVGHGAGLREALEGWTDLVDVIQMSDVPGLAVLRSGETPPDPAALLSSPAAQKVLADLRKAADIVICDAPPVLPVADASVLAPHMDGVLFVHDPSIAPRTALLDAVRQLRTAGGDVIGGVYNNVSKAQRTYLGYSRYEAYYGGDRTSEAQPSWIPGRLTLQRPDRPDGDGRERPAERAGRGSGA